MNMYELIILGAGSAGFAAGIKASELNKKFAIIEHGTIGGTCVNVGCVPSKRLLTVGDIYYSLKNPNFKEIKNKPKLLDFSSVIAQKDELVTSMRQSKYIDVLNNLKGATFIEGKGVFVSHNEVKVRNKLLSADKFIIATGSSPQIIPFKDITNVEHLTNVEALDLKNRPTSMVIVGGRALALEFAQMYAHFGTKVTVLQRSPRILPQDEPEISEEVTKCLRDEGIEIYTHVEITQVSEKNGIKNVVCHVNGKEMQFEAEHLLMATGRKPNTKTLGLDKAKVETEKGFVKTNKYLQTTNPNVYAAGDCTSTVMLETLAAKMGNVAVRNAFENARRTINVMEVPNVIFTNPQVARVGYTDEEYSAKTGACVCRTIPMSLVPKAQIINDTRGVIKMVIDPKTLTIVGVHIVASLAADMIHEATLAVKFGLTIDDIIDTVHVFPTMSEAIKLVATSFRKDISKLSCCVE